MGNQVYANMMEVSCKSASGKTICAFPDVCMTPPQTPATPPGVPIPYPNTGMSSDTTDGSSSVKISGKEVMLKNKSYFKKSTGDEAGAAPKKGLLTSKNTGKVYFNMWSMDVKVEGENVVRHLDITTHNHASSPGNSPPMPHTDEMAPGGGGGGEAEQSCPVVCPSVGSPVNPILGAKILAGKEDLDFTLEGPLPLPWQRTYRSNSSEAGWFGQGWGSPLEVRLEAMPDVGGEYVDHIDYVDPFGRRIQFPPLPPSGDFFSPHEQLTLARSENGQYLITTSDGLTYWFGDRAEARHRLTSVTDRNNNAIRLEYHDAARTIHVHCSGRQELELAFHESRLVEITELRASIIDGTQRVSLMRYQYSSRGDLTNAFNRTGECVRGFDYNPDRLMCHQVHAGTFEAWYEYIGRGKASKVTRHWDNVGGSWVFEYLADQSVVTDQDGRVARYHFDGKRRWTGFTDFNGEFTARGLDKYGNLRAIVDPAGNVTSTVYDGRGNPIERYDATGALTLIEWHPVFALPVAITDPLNRTTRYAYDDRGNLILEVDPSGVETHYEVDERGLLTAIKDGNGHTQGLRNNAQGPPTHFTDCSGRTTVFTYDANGWLISITDALGQRTTLSYNSAGHLSTHTLADGSCEIYETDLAGRLTAVGNAQGAKTTYRYAPDGLLVQRIDGLGNSLHYNYDRARRLTELVNENGARYLFQYDILGRVVEETEFDDTQTRYSYNSAGYLVETAEGSGSGEAIVTRYRHDALGRVLKQASAGTQTVLEYDAAGQLTQTWNNKVRLQFKYDKAGRRVDERVTVGDRDYTVRSTYDALGNRLQTTLPDGTKLGSLYYGSGHAHQIRLDDDPITDMERDALHREITRSQGALSTSRVYDPAGRLQQQRASIEPSRLKYALNVDANEMEIDRRYRYDSSGRLVAALDRGKQLAYGYDAIHRLIRFNDQRFDFDPAHNLVSLDSQGGGSAGSVKDNRIVVYEDKRYRYDAFGRVIEKTIGADTVVRFKWDDEHRLVETTTTDRLGTRATRYLYDPFGRRIAKRSDKGTTWFLWDGDQLLQQSDEIGDTTFIYEPDSFVPLAQVDRRRDHPDRALAVYYYHCDQVGLPRELTDADGNVAWAGEYRGWGRLCEERFGEQQVASRGGPRLQPLRFQGQYDDDETGLHYNGQRYYDPDIGRFISKDPIGLIGDLNVYAYPTNPVSDIDPLGLANFPSNPGVVRRFMSCAEKKRMKKHGFTYDPNDSRGGISATSTNVPPCNPDKIKDRTGALNADCWADINTQGLNVTLKGVTKGGLPDWKIKDNVTKDRIIQSGRTRKKC